MAIPWRWLEIRIAALPLIFLAVSFASYFLIYGPFARHPKEDCAMSTDRLACERFIDEMSDDRSLFRRYADWLGNAATGDFGSTFN